MFASEFVAESACSGGEELNDPVAVSSAVNPASLSVSDLVPAIGIGSLFASIISAIVREGNLWISFRKDTLRRASAPLRTITSAISIRIFLWGCSLICNSKDKEIRPYIAYIDGLSLRGSKVWYREWRIMDVQHLQ